MPGIAGFFGGWRGLGRFWGLTLAVALIGAISLQLAGPPSARRPAPVIAKHETPPPPSVIHQAPAVVKASIDRPGRDLPGPVNDPDPALLEHVPGSPADTLPRIAADGRKPMRFYAAGFDPTTTRPRVGLLLAGVGLSFADSKKAITDLPPQVTFAVSPYTANAEPLLSSVRLLGHEYVLSIPMEPVRFPLSDAGPKALMTNLSVQEHKVQLLWALSQLQGYAGATSILGALRGERLADMPNQIEPVLAEFEQRGLMYVGAPGQPSPVPHTWSRSVDVVVDEPAAAVDIDVKLAALEALARDRGSALGLAVAPRPVTVDRIAAWTTGLANRGLALAPVSALMQPPEDPPK